VRVQPEKNSLNRTARKERLAQDSSKGQAEQDRQNRSAISGLLGKDRARQPGPDSYADCQDVTAERLWALEPGFRYYAAKGKKRKFAFFLSLFCRAPSPIFGFALGSAKKGAHLLS
jgi:hypothetical protein